MKKIIMKTVTLLLTAVITAQTSAISYAGAEGALNNNAVSSEYEIMYYDNTVPILKGTEDTSNPDLAALAAELGYNENSFRFPNFSSGSLDESVISEEEFNAVFERTLGFFSNEEETHCKKDLYITAASGMCYGMSMIPVLIQNGVIKPSDIQADAETLHDVEFNASAIQTIMSYTFSQCYHKIVLAQGMEDFELDEEGYVKKLISTAKRCHESNTYFMVSYGGTAANFENKFLSHAVTGIGMAEGSWKIEGYDYDLCILTYDSNRVDHDDHSVSGTFTEKLCIYVNTETYDFCIPGYGVTSHNDGYIGIVSDNTERFCYRAPINGTDDLSDDLSGVVQILDYSPGSKYKLWTNDKNGNPVNVWDETNCIYEMPMGGRFFVYPSTEYTLEWDTAGEKDFSSTGINSSVYGDTWCSRFGCSGWYKFKMDISKEKVSVTNEGAVEPNEDVKDSRDDFRQQFGLSCYDDNEADIDASLSFDDDEYYTFFGYATENETVTIERFQEGVKVSASDGTLKGLFNIYSDSELIGINIKDSFYGVLEDGKTKIYLDTDKDGVYDELLQQGDTDGNGIIEIKDAAEVLKYYAENAAGLGKGRFGWNKYYPLSIQTANMNDDTEIGIDDAAKILETYAKTASGMQ